MDIQTSICNPFLILDYKSAYNFQPTNYLKGCCWSPDGTCLLALSQDKKFKIYNISETVLEGQFNDETWLMGGWKDEVEPAVVVQENEDVFDYAWYPAMQSTDSKTCCFAAACRDMPVHLWDAWTGDLICSYSSYNNVDELEGAASVTFSTDCQYLTCGFNKVIRIFNTDRPGRTCTQIIKSQSQNGIFSCIRFHPHLPKLFAVGSYSGSVGFYSLESNKNFAVLHGHSKGVTHMQFSQDGTKLYSGTRMDNEILCWDIRNPGQILNKFIREVATNQRIYFHLSPLGNRYLVSGSTSGRVLIWDTINGAVIEEPDEDIPSIAVTRMFRAHLDCTNGISLHPSRPLLATSSGQRHGNYKSRNNLISDEVSEDSDEDEKNDAGTFPENTIKLWSTSDILSR